MKPSWIILKEINDTMRAFPRSWKSYKLNHWCATFVGRKTGKVHETESLGELIEKLKEEEI